MPALLPNIDPDGLLEYSVVYTDRSLNHMSQSFQGVMRDISSTLKKVYAALKSLTGAERVYQIVFLEGIAHFHAWLVPRRDGDEKGMPFISKDIVCEQADAEKLANALQEALN